VAVPQLRAEVLELCDTVQAIVTFNYHYSAEDRNLLEAIRADVPTAPARQLRQYRDDLRGTVKNMVRKFGCKANPTKFAREFKETSRREPGRTLLLPKFEIDKIFTNYTDKWMPWDSFPPHVLVYLDFTGESYRPKQFDWKLPEASLYEDMCVAYNQALDAHKIASMLTVPVPEAKLAEFCLRTAVLSAFYFVEGYLNGVAFDYYVRNAKNISDEEAELLLEWNRKLGKEKWISLKEKLHKYPRIILGLQHPPLTETNSAEMKLLITTAKDVRDAIVHQSPKFDPTSEDVSSKVRQFVHLRLGDVTQTVDAAVVLIKRLNGLLGKNGIMVDWLLERDGNGRFPEQAFL